MKELFLNYFHLFSSSERTLDQSNLLMIYIRIIDVDFEIEFVSLYFIKVGFGFPFQLQLGSISSQNIISFMQFWYEEWPFRQAVERFRSDKQTEYHYLLPFFFRFSFDLRVKNKQTSSASKSDEEWTTSIPHTLHTQVTVCNNIYL